jgi:hypothetical protein
LVAHTGWHWMLDRGTRLRQYRFEWPALDATLLALLLRWLILFTILAGLLWLFRMALRWWTGRTAPAARGSAEPVATPVLAPMESGISLDRPN